MSATVLLACSSSGGASDGSGGSGGHTPPPDGAVANDAAGTGGAGSGTGGTGGTAGGAGNGAGGNIPLPGRAVLLFTGDNGGTPSTDLNVTAVRDTYQAAQITAEISTTLPADFSTRFGVLGS